MLNNNALAKGMLIATTEMGIVIDKWETDDKGMPNKVFISVPEHSEINTMDFYSGQECEELSGEVLAQQFKKIMRRQNENLIVMSKIRKNEIWTKEKIITNTVEQINMTLRTYLGGYLRFQGDNYIGGTNPWIVATAWMGLYYKKIGNQKSANECMRFIVNSATETGLLAEQANSDLNEKWVIGLGWSHAMFIDMLV